METATIDSLVETLQQYLPAEQVCQVRRAYEFAANAHQGQRRRSGQPYITHPLAVAQILSEMHMDHQCLMAALLHDVMEDTGVDKVTLAAEFDPTVADLVDAVTKMQNVFQSRETAEAENFQKMALAMAKDLRVILVKMADRLHNMRTLDVLDPDRRRSIAKETLEIYSPIANRLGMNAFRVEFEELGFKYLYPLRSSMIGKAVKRARGSRRDVIAQTLETIRGCLSREGIDAQVIGREKHLYSIYNKMRSKRRSFQEVMDLHAFRIIVKDVDTCYRVLGKVHSLYKPVFNQFKDYIAVPKNNGYQSIHTVLISDNHRIEIQIRTQEMDAVANTGIAGHWLYKAHEGTPNPAHLRAREWLMNVLDLQQSAGNSKEFIEHMKVDLYPSDVFVFTPKGQIMQLTQGSTPVDLAYLVHTDIGNTCVACRIDHRISPLSTVLESGQTVEIITSPTAGANPAWLNFVRTGRARSSIRNALKNRQRSESITLGRRLLERTLSAMGYELDRIPLERIDQVVAQRRLRSFDDLQVEIGLGNQIAYVIARNLVADGPGAIPLEPDQLGPLAIRGSEGLVVNYAKCCYPIPGDSIVGHINAGKGIVIHVDNCHNMLENDKAEEKIPLTWEPEVQGEYAVELRVEAEHNRTLVASIASTITLADAAIDRINILDDDSSLSTLAVLFAVRDRVHLAHIIRRLRTIKEINKITRVRN